MENQKYALLIDSDNISHKYISCILDEMSKYGVTTYKSVFDGIKHKRKGKLHFSLVHGGVFTCRRNQRVHVCLAVGLNGCTEALLFCRGVVGLRT